MGRYVHALVCCAGLSFSCAWGDHDPGRPMAVAPMPDGPGPDAAAPGGPDAGPSTGPTFDPGRVTLRRLNRAEYDATVRDLLGTRLRPAQAFPPDDVGRGFDNIAEVLSLSPLHLEMYELAADAIIADALVAADVASVLQRVEAESGDVVATVGAANGIGWNLWSNGSIDAGFVVDVAGRYRLSVSALGHQAGDELVRMALRVNGLEQAVVDVDAVRGAPQIYAVEVELSVGGYSAGAAFLNDFFDRETGADRNLIVDWIALEGPLDMVAEPPPGRALVFICEPDGAAPTSKDASEDACARDIIAHVGGRAWRRPLTDDEIARLFALYALVRDSDGDWDEGVLLAIKAMLVSHNFFFLVETGGGELDPWQLANRLSYFLWSSMPDEALFARAAAGDLLDSTVLAAEVRRMLADPKAVALVDNFAGQWLYIRAVDDIAPDYGHFPHWSEDLRASMKEEMRLMAEEILLRNRSMLDLLIGAETRLDGRLATHYGLPAPDGDWAPVSLMDSARTGIITSAGLLSVLAYPTRTSPVRRGKWVLEQLLCQSPPPPPPGVEGLLDGDDDGRSLREKLVRHSLDPTCAGCHQTMDPIGFALEGFDATGRYRAVDRAGFAIDDSGVLPNGMSFTGSIELAAVLVRDPSLARCMAEQAFTYALGRTTTTADEVYLEHIVAHFTEGNYRFAALAEAIVLSEAFRFRRDGAVTMPPAAAAAGAAAAASFARSHVGTMGDIP